MDPSQILLISFLFALVQPSELLTSTPSTKPFEITAKICTWRRNKLDCPMRPYDFFTDIIKVPPNVCSEKNNNCSGCLVNWETYVYDKDALQLYKIEKLDFHLKQKETSAGEDIMYKCENKNTRRPSGCGYNQSCDGTPRYCTYQNCKPGQPADTDLVQTYMEKKLYNPKLYSFRVCYFQESDYKIPARKPLSVEEVKDKNNEEALISFQNPVLYLKTQGILILRKDGIETIKQVHVHPYHFQLPDELLLNKGLLHVILIDPLGKTIEGN